MTSTRSKNKISEKLWFLPVLLLVFQYIGISFHLILEFSRNYLDKLYLFDQIIFEQTLLSFMSGKGLQAPYEIINIFSNNHNAIHLQPILYILAPIYNLFPHSITLKAIQICIVLSGVIPLYLFSKKHFQSTWMGLFFGTLFLNDYILHDSLLTDFHPVTLAVTAYLWCLYFVFMNKGKLAVLSALFALLTKETEAAIVFLIGIYTWICHEKRKAGISLVSVSIVWIFICFGLIFPMLTNDSGYIYTGIYNKLFVAEGTNASSISDRLFNERNTEFLQAHLGRFYYLPLLNLALLIPVLPNFFFIFLSSDPCHGSISSHYSIILLPFVYMSFIVVLKQLWEFFRKYLPTLPLSIYKLLLVVFLLQSLFFSGGWQKTVWDRNAAFLEKRNPPMDLVKIMQETIPPEDTISFDPVFAPFMLYSHTDMQFFPHDTRNAVWLGFRLMSQWAEYHESIHLLYLFHKGFLPVTDHWKQGYYFLGQDRSEYGEEFYEMVCNQMTDGYSFTEPKSELIKLFPGFSYVTGNGTWTRNKNAALLFGVPEDLTDGIKISIHGYFPLEYLDHQTVLVKLNGEELVTKTIGAESSDFSVEVGSEKLSARLNFMEFLFSNSLRRSGFVTEKNSYEQAYRFSRIEFQPVENAFIY